MAYHDKIVYCTEIEDETMKIGVLKRTYIVEGDKVIAEKNQIRDSVEPDTDISKFPDKVKKRIQAHYAEESALVKVWKAEKAARLKKDAAELAAQQKKLKDAEAQAAK